MPYGFNDDKSKFDLAQITPQYPELKTLWSGYSWVMNETQTANLSEKISEQKHGIILAWSAIVNGTGQNYDWNFTVIPKMPTTTTTNANGTNCNLGTNTKNGRKYIYVYDNRLVGHTKNDENTTVGGVSNENAYWALRAVYGF